MVPQIPLFSRRFFHVLERFMKQTQEKDCLSKITGMMRSESKCDYITWYFFFNSLLLDYLFDARTFSCET